jgi:hypothetical protein
LYRQLLRAHRTKLPKAMRDLGDSYIRYALRLLLLLCIKQQLWTNNAHWGFAIAIAVVAFGQQ